MDNQKYTYKCKKCESDDIGTMRDEQGREFEYCRMCGATWQDIQRKFKPPKVKKGTTSNKDNKNDKTQNDEIQLRIIGAGMTETAKLMWVITMYMGKGVIKAGEYSLKALSVMGDVLFKSYDELGDKYLKGNKAKNKKRKNTKQHKQTKKPKPYVDKHERQRLKQIDKELAKDPYDSIAKPTDWED